MINSWVCRILVPRWMIRRCKLRGMLWGGRRLVEICGKVDAVDFRAEVGL